MRQKAANAFRFVNCEDIVTQIPRPVPYKHIDTEIYINRAGAILVDPSAADKFLDASAGALEHDGAAAIIDIVHPARLISLAEEPGPLPDPPPFLVGNHTPARYAIRIWNYYSGL